MNIRTIETSGQCHGRLTGQLFDLWDELREGRLAPMHSDFDYLQRPELVKILVVLRAPTGSSELKVRFTGSEVVSTFASETKTDVVSEILTDNRQNPEWAEYGANTRIILDMCRKERRPVLNGPKLLSVLPMSFVEFESLCVPFIDADGLVNQIVIAVDQTPISPEEARSRSQGQDPGAHQSPR